MLAGIVVQCESHLLWGHQRNQTMPMNVSDAPQRTDSAHQKDLRVIEVDPRTDPRWESFVCKHPDGAIYHHPAWLIALECEYGQKGIYLACVNSDEQLLAVLPLVSTRGLPFRFGGALAGRRISSLPRTPVAGPLSTHPQATAALLQEAVRRVTAQPGTTLQVKAQEPDLDGLVDGVVGMPWRQTFILQLPAQLNEPYRISNSRQRGVVRWAINKAERMGVRIRSAETASDLKAWYRLYLETMRRSFVPPRPYRFFLALWEHLRPAKLMNLLIAEQELAGRHRIIAGAVFLTFGKTMSYSFSGSGSGDLSLLPNDLLIWRAINDACEKKCQFFDLGEVPEGKEGLAKFKKKWGAEPVRMYRYYYPISPTAEDDADEPKGSLIALVNSVWTHLPLWAVSWIGDQVYSRL